MNKSKKILGMIEGIADDTSILPEIIAETVLGNAIDYLSKSGKEDETMKLESREEEYIKKLVDRAEKMYELPEWKKKIRAKGNAGRNLLYSFMQHWLSSYIRNDLGIDMPQSFAVKGEPL